MLDLANGNTTPRAAPTSASSSGRRRSAGARSPSGRVRPGYANFCADWSTRSCRANRERRRWEWPAGQRLRRHRQPQAGLQYGDRPRPLGGTRSGRRARLLPRLPAPTTAGLYLMQIYVMGVQSGGRKSAGLLVGSSRPQPGRHRVSLPCFVRALGPPELRRQTDGFNVRPVTRVGRRVFGALPTTTRTLSRRPGMTDPRVLDLDDGRASRASP